jgi:hypothetical protein
LELIAKIEIRSSIFFFLKKKKISCAILIYFFDFGFHSINARVQSSQIIHLAPIFCLFIWFLLLAHLVTMCGTPLGVDVTRHNFAQPEEIKYK